jgi:hypothetical protein
LGDRKIRGEIQNWWEGWKYGGLEGWKVGKYPAFQVITDFYD